jgi:hypothetical protein
MDFSQGAMEGIKPTPKAILTSNLGALFLSTKTFVLVFQPTLGTGN